MRKTRWLRAAAALAAVTLVATACGGDDDDDTTTGGETTGGTQTDTGGETTGGETTGGDTGGMSLDDIEMGVGVTAEPCPEAVDENHGCIYLGTISDFSGPFAGFGEPLTLGQEAFWQRVNENGGIGGLFEVNVGEYVEDASYNAEKHVQAYQKIEPNVLALAQSLGTSQSLAIAEDMAANDVVSSVQTWWSGWEFNDNFTQNGSNYCIDAMNAVEWALEQNPDIQTVMDVFFPNDYGKDSVAGATRVAAANELEFSSVPQVPKVAGGNTEEAISTIVRDKPDLVILTTGPTEMAEIVGGAAQGGYQGMFIGHHPTFFPQLMDTAAAPAIQAMYWSVAPGQPYSDGESAGHDALREALPEPPNDGVTFGWVSQYPLKALLEKVVADGAVTRAAMAAAVPEIEVDYEGMAPAKTYGGDANDTVQRQSTINKPDPELQLKIGTVEAAYTGPTAEGFDFTEPCAQP